MRVFLIHGALGNPDENWFPWIRQELENDGHEVIAPTFPTPQGQSLFAWQEVFSSYHVNSDDVFVAHSLGPAFVLSLLEKVSCKACFFVSGFTGFLDNETFDTINRSFVDRDFDWELIRRHCEEFSTG